MTDLLIKIFVKNSDNVKNPHVRAAYGKLAGSIGIFCNVFLFLIKLTSGAMSKSISVIADGFNNLSDASSSVVSLLGFKLSGRSADTKHPFGHARYEYLAGLFVSVMILVIGVELFKSGIKKVIFPENTVYGKSAFLILLVSVAVKLWMMIFNKNIAEKINSKTLEATASDSRNDVISTLAVLCGAVISHFFNINLDGVMGILVALFIFVGGIKTLKDMIDPLLGQAPDDELVEYVKNTVLSYPEIIGIHDLMVHDYGPGRQFASIHVEMNSGTDIVHCHDVIDKIEKSFLDNYNLHMVVHLDPVSQEKNEVNKIYARISERIKSIDNRLSIHDLRITNSDNNKKISFDCAVFLNCPLSEKELKTKIYSLLKNEYPKYDFDITLDNDIIPISRDKDEKF